MISHIALLRIQLLDPMGGPDDSKKARMLSWEWEGGYLGLEGAIIRTGRKKPVVLLICGFINPTAKLQKRLRDLNRKPSNF